MDDQEQQQGQQSKHQQSPPAQDASPKTATPEETVEELEEAIKGSNEVLATVTTVLPIFPDTVTLDRAKMTITKRTFFSSAQVMSMRIEDILNVTTTMGPLFASLRITSRVMSAGDPNVVGPFWRRDAIRFKNIAQGYVIALQREMDLSVLPKKELVDMLRQLGRDEHPS
jgi:hypothetical protein